MFDAEAHAFRGGALPDPPRWVRAHQECAPALQMRQGLVFGNCDVSFPSDACKVKTHIPGRSFPLRGVFRLEKLNVGVVRHRSPPVVVPLVVQVRAPRDASSSASCTRELAYSRGTSSRTPSAHRRSVRSATSTPGWVPSRSEERRVGKECRS